jgi:hypothetical protein
MRVAMVEGMEGADGVEEGMLSVSRTCHLAAMLHWPQPWIDCGVRIGRRHGVPAMHCCECCHSQALSLQLCI